MRGIQKRKTANFVMVMVIAAVMAAGIIIAGNIKGWFDSEKTLLENAVVSEKRGVVNVLRDGISFGAKEQKGCRSGDRLTTQSNSTVALSVGESLVTVWENADITVKDASVQGCVIQIHKGEVFADVQGNEIVLEYGSRRYLLEDTACLLSAETGSSECSVFSGKVQAVCKDADGGEGEEDTEKRIRVEKGKALRCIGQQAEVVLLDIETLDDFALEMLKRALEHSAEKFCFSREDIRTLEESRREEIVIIKREEQDNKTTVKLQPTTGSLPGGEEKAAGIPEPDTEPVSSTVIKTTGAGEETTKKAEAPQKRTGESTTAGGKKTTEGQETTKEKGTAQGQETTEKRETTENQGTTEKQETTEGQREPETEEPEQEEPDKIYQCTVKVSCGEILSNMDKLKEGKDRYVPQDGLIIKAVTVEFVEGETVFDVLKRVCSYMEIPLEYSYTPLYESYYVEGINHIYEFDCGRQSGWRYKVNGCFAGKGCSEYELEDGDSVLWEYTCY